MKKIIVALITLMLLIHPLEVSASTPNAWAEDHITNVSESAIIDMERFEFLHEPISREDYGYLMFQLYEHLSDSPIAYAIENGQGTDFADTEDLRLRALKGAGLVNGYPDGSYRPDARITREEIMMLYVRLLEALNYELPIAETSFSDWGRVSDWATSSVSKCTAAGIIQGRGDGTVDPKGYATVEESLVVFSRILQDLRFEPSEQLDSAGAEAIAAYGFEAYMVNYDIFGQSTGIDVYEDFTYKSTIYHGALFIDSIYLTEEALYYFDEEGKLMLYDGDHTSTGFVTTHEISDWYVAGDTVNYLVDEQWYEYDFLAKTVLSISTRTQENIYIVLNGHLLKDGLTVSESVLGYTVVGNNVLYIDNDSHLYEYLSDVNETIDYGITGAEDVSAVWNYLILTIPTINGKSMKRYVPLFALEDFL